jgi:hypothetical protein
MLSVNELNYGMSTRFSCIGSSGAGLEYRPAVIFLVTEFYAGLICMLFGGCDMEAG